MTRRALSFGPVAPAYERYRLGYPDALVDAVLAYAGRPVRHALEVGAGTGKATRLFAGRGIDVTATDPDPAMLAELTRNVPDTVRTVQAAFEDLPLAPRYDLVYAAASMHWTRPEQRWTRVAALLTNDGVFACFGGQLHLADADLEQAVRTARAPILAEDGFPEPEVMTVAGPMRWPGTELVECDAFTDVRQSTIERRATLSAADYIGHLSTISAYLQLPADERTQVFELIRGVLPGQVAVTADVTVHLARLPQGPMPAPMAGG